MLAKRIIPCLDVKDGRVVKGVNFVNLRDAGDPVEQARIYDRMGADELVFLDISATYRGHQTVIDIVRSVADQVFMPLTVGGGIRSISDIKLMLKAGADKVSINTAAVKNPDFVRDATKQFGSQCIVVAIDAKRIKHESDDQRWEVYTHGGRNNTGIDVVAWAKKMADIGAGEILLTSMDKDGTKDGFDIELTKTISKTVNIPVIASGGVGNLNHLAEGILNGRADAVLAASIFHFGKNTIADVKKSLSEKNIEVRL